MSRVSKSSTPLLESLSLISGRGHIPALDGLRGIAVIMVMLHHFVFYGRMGAGNWIDVQVKNVLLSGWVGVDLFFVLSGFLITGILMDSKGDAHYFKKFYVRRILRIFPLYYGVLVAIFLVVPLFHNPGPRLGSLLDQQGWYWGYLINIDIGLHGWPSNHVLAHFWSLAIEEQFYLVWPLVVALAHRRAFAQICCGIVVFSLLVRIGLVMADVKTAAYVLTPARADSLAVGGLLALMFRSKRGLVLLSRGVLPVACVAGLAVLSLYWWKGWFNDSAASVLTLGLTATALFFGSIVVYAVAAPSNHVVGRILNSKTLRIFGRYSYALYVFHHPVSIYLPKYLFRIDRFPLVFDSQLIGLVIFIAVATAISLVLAVLSWHLLEARFLALKRAFEYEKRPRRTPLEEVVA